MKIKINISIIYKWVLLITHIILLISFLSVIYSNWIALELMARALPLAIALGLSTIGVVILIKSDN